MTPADADLTLHTMIFRCGWTPPAAAHVPACHSFAEPSAASARSEVALAGRDGQRAADLLAAAKRHGTELFATLTERAVRRILAMPASQQMQQPVLFDDDELEQLASMLGGTIATADLLGRSRVRQFVAKREAADKHTMKFGESDIFRAVYDFWFRADGSAKTRATVESMVIVTMREFGLPRPEAERIVRAALDASNAASQATKFADPPALPLGSPDDPFDIFPEPIPFQPPAEAVSYFNRLIPSIGTDPYRYGALLERHAFTLAAAADMALLDKVKQAITKKVQGAIGSRIAGDPSAPLGTATADVQDILDAAGVSSANPQYAEMLVRSNLMDAYNHGQMAEMARPEMREKFPVWRYEGIRDGRQGKDHEPKFDKYYPSTAIFADVRGPRVWNCRCCATPLFHTEWAELQASGARVESSW